MTVEQRIQDRNGFNPWGGITIHGVYYFLGAGPDLHTLYRHIAGEAHSDDIGTYGNAFNPMEVLIDILNDRRELAQGRRI